MLELMIAGVAVLLIAFFAIRFVVKVQIKFFFFFVFCVILGFVFLYWKYGDRVLQWLPFDF